MAASFTYWGAFFAIGASLSPWCALAASNKVDCIVNTGGSCVSNDCFAWRGPTKCDAGRCFCKDNTCAGADEVCSNDEYVKVGTVNNSGTQYYKIRNARWPEYYLDVEYSGTVQVAKDKDSKDRQFELLMPSYAGGETPLANPLFLLKSREWPESVVSVYHSDGEYRPVCQNVDGGWGGFLPDPALKMLGLYMTKAPEESSDENRVLVMFSSMNFPSYYMYSPSSGASLTGGYALAMQRNDPGAGGYWFFEPYLPKDIQDRLLDYTGPRCTAHCGKVSMALPMRSSRLVVLLGLVLLLWK